MLLLILITGPFCLLFEGWQLVIAERHLGVKRLASNIDPRRHGPSEGVSFAWVLGLALYGLWMVAMLMPRIGRAQIVAMIVVSLLGYSARRNCGLKWVLVILTLEGAIRIGMLTSLLAMVWRRL